MSSDAHHLTQPRPDGAGAVLAMTTALASGGVAAADIDYVNLHGTATALNDAMESMALRDVCGASVPCSSSKPQLGHTLGAAGAIEAIATVLAIQNDIVPPTINHFTDDPEIAELDFTFNEGKKRELHYALSNTFGFGGHNACILLRKYEG